MDAFLSDLAALEKPSRGAGAAPPAAVTASAGGAGVAPPAAVETSAAPPPLSVTRTLISGTAPRRDGRGAPREVEAFRRDFRDRCPAERLTCWADAGFNPKLRKWLEVAGFERPTAVQALVIPAVLHGKDVVAEAPTGTGKTLAFLLPLVTHVMAQRAIDPGEGPIALVLCSTRELGQQTYAQLRRLFRPQGATVCSLLAAQSKWAQAKELRAGVEAVVGTPGRLLDMVSTGKALPLSRVTFVVLDEADRMLDLGFKDQVNGILGGVRPDRQLVTVAASRSGGCAQLRRLVASLVREAVLVSVGAEAAGRVPQTPVLVDTEADKVAWFAQHVRSQPETARTIVFVATRNRCDQVSSRLAATTTAGVRTAPMHGGMDHAARQAAILAFRRGEARVLVATDLVARGLHFPDATHVICWDASKDVATHVNRLGRIGRLGGAAPGACHSLVRRSDTRFAKTIVETMRADGQLPPLDLQRVAGPQAKPLVYGRFVRGGTQRPQSGRDDGDSGDSDDSDGDDNRHNNKRQKVADELQS